MLEICPRGLEGYSFDRRLNPFQDNILLSNCAAGGSSSSVFQLVQDLMEPKPNERLQRQLDICSSNNRLQSVSFYYHAKAQ